MVPFIYFFFPNLRLAKEEELLDSQKRNDELEKENLELATQLAKKEAELDVKTQEKEDIEANLERTKEKLETETARHNELKQRLSESDAKIDVSKPIGIVNNKAPIPPPPAPPMAPPPPPGPPPPPSLSAPNAPAKPSIKKNIPQSSSPLVAQSHSNFAFDPLKGNFADPNSWPHRPMPRPDLHHLIVQSDGDGSAWTDPGSASRVLLGSQI